MGRMAGTCGVVVAGALALLLEGCSGCAYLSGEYACEQDDNCPFELACVDGLCVAEALPPDGVVVGEGEGEGEGEGCPEHVREGDHEVESRGGLDALRPPEGACLVIDGTLEVQDVSSLAALATLVRVEGNLVLEDLEADTLEGLENLRVIGGSLRVFDNDELTSLDGLAGLREVGGDLDVRRNRELPACEAFELRDRLTVLGGDLIVAENQGSCPDGP